MHVTSARQGNAQDTGTPGYVGPNAVIQLAHALRDVAGTDTQRHVFERAGFRHLLDALPAEMIDERVPAMLFDALWQVLPPGEAGAVARDAGRRTAQYILANRIPPFAQVVLKALPATFAAPLLLKAIQNNAWTFAGSGICTTTAGRPATIAIESNPLGMPDCAWHQGVFECLFQTLVSHRTRVTHPACCAAGHAHCRFELHY